MLSGISEVLTIVEPWVRALRSARSSWNAWDPSSLQARIKVAVFTRAIQGVVNFGGFGKVLLSSKVLQAVVAGGVGTEAGSEVLKVILPNNTQSIVGLWRVSQL